MTVLAVQAIRKMRGGAQSQLMLDSKEIVWVVKFQNNPQHLRVLANEFITTRLAEAVGLSVPECSIVEVPAYLVDNTAAMYIELGSHKSERYASGLQFGSRLVGQMNQGQVMDYLPEPQLMMLRNLREFAGVLCLDKWLANCDGRQAVFTRTAGERVYSAHFIDHGFCFNAGDWNFPDAPLRGAYGNNLVYAKVTGWESFEPWLSAVETIQPKVLSDIVKKIPPEWYDGDKVAIERLVERLLHRRSRVRELIQSFRDSDRSPFPNWV